jgi:hypothetical protein
MDQQEKDELCSNTIGCGRAKIIADVINDGGEISELEEAFLHGHMKLCEDCTSEYEQTLASYKEKQSAIDETKHDD